MGFARSLQAVARASGDHPIDWEAVETAALAATDPGDLELTEEDRAAYAANVRDARDRIEAAIEVSVEIPGEIEIHHRHHWIRANVTTFQRLLAPLAERSSRFPAVTRTVNTGSMAASLAFLANHVLGQFDPLLLAAESEHPKLYFVDPNIRRVAPILDVDLVRFRRWIAFHEVAHAAEFSSAPWLADHLETRIESAIEQLAAGELPRESFSELHHLMTVVEGYAEFMMDRTFDGDAADLRAAIDAHRRRRGPLDRLLSRLLGLEMKRRQYETGRAFFEGVSQRASLTVANEVWTSPESLPTESELESPERWVRRVT